MFVLSRSRRRRLAGVALAFLATGVATMPLKVRSEAGSATMAVTHAAAHSPATAFAAVMPRRDPFAGGTPILGHVAAPVPPLGTTPADSVLPAVPLPPPPIAPARVTAIVTGARPFALVEDAGLTRVVTAGERLSGERIVAIGIDGVHLANGATLAVTPSAAQPTGVR